MPDVSFSRGPGRDLYTATGEGAPDALRPRYLLRRESPGAPQDVALSATWTDPTLDGYYLFLDAPLTPEQEGPFAQAIRGMLITGGTRFLWISRLGAPLPHVTAGIVVEGGALAQEAGFGFRNLSLELERGCSVAPNAAGDGFAVAPVGEARITFRAAGADPLFAAGELRIPLSGGGAGALNFRAPVGRSALLTLGGDVRYFHHARAASGPMVARRFPLFVPPDVLEMDASLDVLRPGDPGRSRFAFRAAAELNGCLNTPTGRRLKLRAAEGAALALASFPDDLGRASGYYLAPSGHFEVVDPAAEGVPAVMCGLQPTEYLAPTAAALEFVAGMPAYAPGFPAGPDRKDLAEPLHTLDGAATTAWVRPVAGEAGAAGYFAQPARAVYFGHPNAVSPRLMDVVPVRVAEYGVASKAVALPMAPYAGVGESLDGNGGAPLNASVDAEALGAFERDVLAATRWRVAPFLREGPRFGAGTGPAPHLAAAPRRALVLATGAGLETAVSPQGFLATLNADGSWRELVLARGPGGEGRLAVTPADGHEAVPRDLALALLSSEVFLVVSVNAADTLGTFHSRVTIGGFTLDLAPAARGTAEAGPILIFKFRQGRLRDLVEDVNLWTRPGQFNEQRGDRFPVQDTIRQFLLAAEHSGDPALTDFVERIVDAPAWRGVLALNCRVTGLREEMEGLRARMPRPLTGHHLGIEVNQVRTDPAEIVTSSLFGLIRYPPVVEPPPRTPRGRVPALRLATAVGDEAARAAPYLPLRERDGGDAGGGDEPPDQDFVVEELTVAFRNSEVADFACRVQLLVRRLFGRDVERVGEGGEIIPLVGTFQSREGVDGFALRSGAPARFRLPAPDGVVRVLRDVAITSAEFVTAPLEALGDGRARVTARFVLEGGLGFAADALPLDLFGYGGADGAALLPFGGLSLEYSFVRDSEGRVSDAGPLRFDAAGVAFGAPPEGALRSGSLVAGMPLQLRGFRAAPEGLSAPGAGAQAVQVPLLTRAGEEAGADSPGGHLTAAPRYALDFRLPLGSLGSLSTVQVSLDAGLLLGWGPGETVPQDDAVAVWVKLPALTPGVAGYSLQGVLKTTFGEGNLLRFSRTGGRDVYSLLFNNVALKLFGITLPPGVVLDFVLFADPGEAPGKSNLGWYLGYVPDGEDCS
jgi:hypothetical protein